jgi:hypothetical protein
MFRALFSILALLAGLGAYAQAAFVKAYLINGKGDTLRGEAKINPKKEFENYYKVVFRDEKGQQKTYKPEKIKGFGFEEDHYVTITEDDESLFFKVLARGTITLYKFMYEGLRMNKPVYVPEYYLMVPDKDRLVLVKENKFKKQISDYMDDNPELVKGYEEGLEFEPAKAAELITQYNAWKTAQIK